MIHALAVAALLAASPAAPSQASSTAAPAKEAPLAVQVAREFITPEFWNRSLSGIIAEYAAKLRAMGESSGFTVDAGMEAEMRRMYDQIIPYSDVIDLQASLMQKYFSEAELKELLAFYRSPLGAKLRDRTPELQRDAIAMIMQKADVSQLGQALASHFHRADEAEPSAAPAPQAEQPKQPAADDAKPKASPPKR